VPEENDTRAKAGEIALTFVVAFAKRT
jgi:hypothetical protein